jgi:hypothetical protein
VVERFRAFLDRPLEPSTSRAVIGLALAVGTGLAVLAVLGGVAGRPAARPEARPQVVPPGSGRVHAGRPSLSAPVQADQDPQDRPGTAAHRRAASALAHHRALQHVPYSTGGVSIELVGARRGKAVLRVVAATEGAARQGWRAFLRRFDDDGGAYLHVLKVRGGRG